MAFNSKEQEIIRYGKQSGKTRQEVEQAIINYRTGVVAKPRVEEAPQEQSLGSKLLDRVGNVGNAIHNGLNAGKSPTTLGEFGSGAAKMINAGASIPGQAIGAVGDVLGAGLEATGLDKPIAAAVAPVVNSAPFKAGVEKFKALPQEAQDLLGNVGNIASIVPVAEAFKFSALATKAGRKSVDEFVADTVQTSLPNMKNMGNKVIETIAADPEKRVQTLLKESTPDELAKHLDMAEKAAADPRLPTPFEYVGGLMSDATKTLKSKADAVGAAKSEFLKPLREGLDPFVVETKSFVDDLMSLKNSISDMNIGDKKIVAGVINAARQVKTKLDADKFIDELQDMLYTGNAKQTIVQGSSLEQGLRRLLGGYNNSLKKGLPKEYAALNDQYARLAQNLGTLNRSLGEVVEGVPVQGASLVKQFFSPAGAKAKELFEYIKAETGVDLAKETTLGKFAMDLFDDPRSKSLLAGLSDVPLTIPSIIAKGVDLIGGGRFDSAMRKGSIRKAERMTKKKESSFNSGAVPETAKLVDEFIDLEPGVIIANPTGIIPIGKFAQFTRRAFKHFIEKRKAAGNTKDEINYLIEKSPEVIERPELKIPNPDQKAYPGSDLLGRYYEDVTKAVMVILDKENKVRDIISLHYKNKKDFERYINNKKK